MQLPHGQPFIGRLVLKMQNPEHLQTHIIMNKTETNAFAYVF